MQYQFCQGSSDKYATSLRIDAVSQRLTWDVSRGTDTIVLQSPYGENPGREGFRFYCGQMSQKGMRAGTYTQLTEDVRACYVSAEEKAAKGGCVVDRKACRYTVIACQKEGDACNVFEPYEQGMNVPYCDVPLEIRLELHRQVITTGTFFWKKKQFTGFYTLTFPKELKENFIEHGLCYRAGGLEIPVTSEMVRQGTVYIETNEEPEIVRLKNGNGCQTVPG